MGGRIEITKDHVGKVVFGYPTGNNARRGVEKQELKQFEVVGFGRKYARVMLYGYETSVHPKTGATQNSINQGFGGNAGYMFFECQCDADDYLKAADFRRKVACKLSHSSISLLSDSLVREIAIQLGIEDV